MSPRLTREYEYNENTDSQKYTWEWLFLHLTDITLLLKITDMLTCN